MKTLVSLLISDRKKIKPKFVYILLSNFQISGLKRIKAWPLIYVFLKEIFTTGIRITGICPVEFFFAIFLLLLNKLHISLFRHVITCSTMGHGQSDYVSEWLYKMLQSTKKYQDKYEEIHFTNTHYNFQQLNQGSCRPPD